MSQYITLTMLIPVVVLALLLTFFLYYWSASARPGSVLEAARLPARRPMAFAGHRHPMEKKDTLPLLALTAAYAITAFFQLGSASAPQSRLDLSGGQCVELALDQPVRLTKIAYFSGLGTGGYHLEISSDGDHWSALWTREEEGKTVYYWADAEGYAPSYAMSQLYNDLFKWNEIQLDNPQYVRYLRITGKENRDGPLELAELALYSATGESRDPQGLLNVSMEAQADRNGNDTTGILVTQIIAPEQVPPFADAPPPSAAPLFDEQDTIPRLSSWYNSAYFDEIYHPRTALEHIQGVYPYEVSHPPLGKLILSLGIRCFGMTPFGWRFMGTLFGVLMLPILYIFLKNLFGKTVVAACGTGLLAADFMHLTQTRIATIDTYGVFFILLMYFFLYRWLTLPSGTSFWRGAVPLFLSGLCWGLGVASKWTVIYGGLGLAVLYFVGLGFHIRDWPTAEDGRRTGAGPWLVGTLLFSVLCFVLIPLVIYTASYLPYAQAKGVDLSWANTWAGFRQAVPVFFQNLWGKLTLGEAFHAAEFPTDSLSGIMVQNQWFMFTYHEGVTDAHPYSSRWYQWVADARPILYYLDSTSGKAEGMKAAFGCFNNPVLAWGGLLALLTAAARTFHRRWAKGAFFLVSGLTAAALTIRVEMAENGAFAPDAEPGSAALGALLLVLCLLVYLLLGAYLTWTSSDQTDGRALFLLVGYLSQLLPWMLISRTTFEYHYFPSTLFLVVALCWVFNDLMERRPQGWKPGVYGITVGAGALYLLFYPVLVGLMVPTWYTTRLLKWLPSWPF